MNRYSVLMQDLIDLDATDLVDVNDFEFEKFSKWREGYTVNDLLFLSKMMMCVFEDTHKLTTSNNVKEIQRQIQNMEEPTNLRQLKVLFRLVIQ